MGKLWDDLGSIIDEGEGELAGVMGLANYPPQSRPKAPGQAAGGQASPSGGWSGAGLGLRRSPPPPRTANGGGQPARRSTQAQSHDSDLLPSDFWGSASGQVLKDVGDFSRYAGEFGDLIGGGEARDVALTGSYPDFENPWLNGEGRVSVPPAQRDEFIRETPHAASQAAAPISNKLEQAARRQLPPHPTHGDRLVQQATGIADGLPTLLAPPVAAIYYGIRGYGQSYEDALAHHASVEDAEKAGLLNGAAQAGLSLVPGGRAVDELAARLWDPLTRTAVRVVGPAGLGATYSATSQFADNAVARFTYDPERSLSEGVPQAALAGGVFGGAFGAGREAISPSAAPPLTPLGRFRDAHALADAFLRQTQRHVDQVYPQVREAVGQGVFSPPRGQPEGLFFGGLNDRIVHSRNMKWLARNGVLEGPDGVIRLNRRLYAQDGLSYRRPDTYIPDANLILDQTLGHKWPNNPQIRGFNQNSGGANVTIVRPKDLGEAYSYSLPAP